MALLNTRLDRLAGAVSAGLGQAQRERSDLFKRLSEALVEKENFLRYQNFQDLMAEKSRIFQAQQKTLDRAEDAYQFQQEQEMARKELKLKETEVSNEAYYNKKMMELREKDLRTDQYRLGLADIDSDINALQNELDLEMSKEYAQDPFKIQELQQRIQEKQVQRDEFRKQNAALIGVKPTKRMTLAERKQRIKDLTEKIRYMRPGYLYELPKVETKIRPSLEEIEKGATVKKETEVMPEDFPKYWSNENIIKEAGKGNVHAFNEAKRRGLLPKYASFVQKETITINDNEITIPKRIDLTKMGRLRLNKPVNIPKGTSLAEKWGLFISK